MIFHEHADLAGYIHRQCEKIREDLKDSPNSQKYLLGVQRGYYLGICQMKNWETMHDVIAVTELK